jgi:hypothetical protein
MVILFTCSQQPKHYMIFPYTLELYKLNVMTALLLFLQCRNFANFSRNLPSKMLSSTVPWTTLPTYQLCHHWGIRPFIPLDSDSKLTEDNLPQGVVGFDNKGRPLCPGCTPYVNWANCGDKGTKYRCWFAASGKQAPCCCTSSPYGKTVHIKSDDNPRLFTPVPRGTDAFKKKLKQRSGAERSNKRVFEDYKVEAGKTRSSRQRYFRAVFAAINIHLDAWYWHIDVCLADLLERTMQRSA